MADIYAQRFIDLVLKRSINKKMLEYTNEGLGFVLPFATDFEGELRRFIESEGLQLGETFFMGANNEKGPYMVVAELTF